MPGQGKPSVSEVMIEQVQQTFVCNPGKSKRYTRLELNIPRPTVWKVLLKDWYLNYTKYNLCNIRVKVTKKIELNFV